jgi:carbon storage regulator CsrA
MLVLSRKLDQTIQIGDQITITVVSVKGNTVRLGISAPDHIRVARGELLGKPSGGSVAGVSSSKEVLRPSAPAAEIFELDSRPNAPVSFGLRGEKPAGPNSLADLFPPTDYQVRHLRLRLDVPAEPSPTAEDTQQV